MIAASRASAKRGEVRADAHTGGSLRRDRPRALLVRGRSSPSASGRSTSIGSIRTWASSCPSSPKSSFAAMPRPASSSGIRSPDPGRRSWRRTPSARARRAVTCPRSTACSCARRPASTTPPRCSRTSSGSRMARPPAKARGGGRYLRRWFAPRSLAELLSFRERIEGTAYPELWQVVLSRSARSARLARHDDLDFPAEPVSGEYFCHKHRRVCRPVGEADKFLRRYVRDAVQRVQEFADAALVGVGRRSPRRRAAASIRPGRSTSCSRRRPTRASSTTTSSTPTPTSSSASSGATARRSGAG